MELVEISRSSLSGSRKRRGRKSKAARKRAQRATRRPSKSVQLKRAQWAAQKRGAAAVSPVPAVLPPLAAETVNDVTLEIVPKSSLTSSSMSRFISYGLLGGVVYAVLRRQS